MAKVSPITPYLIMLVIILVGLTVLAGVPSTINDWESPFDRLDELFTCGAKRQCECD